MGAAAWPVLEVDEDLAWADMVTLCSLNEGGCHLRCQFSRLGEAAHVAAPAGFSDDVDLGTEEHVKTHCAILFCHYLTETAHHLRVTAGSDAHLALAVGDMREILGAADMAAELGTVARVGGEHDGDAQARSFSNLLHAVGPVGELVRRGDAVVEDATEVLLLDV